MQIVTVKPPRNISASETNLFIPHLTFKLHSLKTKMRKNIFITHSGLCMDRNGLIKESHHAYPEQYNSYVDEATHYIKEAAGNPDALLSYEDNETYLVIHHPWFNYFHWMTESIPRLWQAREILHETTLLIPERHMETDFIRESLEPFCLSKVKLIPSFKSVFVKQLCLPQIKPIVDSYDRKLLLAIRKFYLDYTCGEKKIAVNAGEYIYISRKKAVRKKIANEPEIESILFRFGFMCINNEDYSFLEQVALYSQVKCMISIHGAGLTNMLFMKENGKVLELHKKITNKEDWHSHAFWYLADTLNIGYYQQVCEPTDPRDNYFEANLSVDTVLLEKNIRLMLSIDGDSRNK